MVMSVDDRLTCLSYPPDRYPGKTDPYRCTAIPVARYRAEPAGLDGDPKDRAEIWCCWSTTIGGLVLTKTVADCTLASRVIRRCGMTKDKMIEGVMRASGISKANVERFYDGLVTLAKKELQGRGEFVLPGLGAFKVRTRKARIARNPRTGEPIKVPAKKVVRFVPYSSLKTLFAKKESGPSGPGEDLI